MNYVYSVTFSCGALFSSMKKAKQRVNEIVQDLNLKIVKVKIEKYSTYFECESLNEMDCDKKTIVINQEIVY